MSCSIQNETSCITLDHGSGGKRMSQLIDDIFISAFSNPFLQERGDSALLGPIEGRLVMSTDSFVISPLFFQGGDIGTLAVCGTVNDICTSGAKPLYLSLGCIIEAGFPIEDLKRIATSLATTAESVGISIVTGDTKVVEKGKGDGIFINTTGIGSISNPHLDLRPSRARAGDAILLSGSLGDHGIAIMSQRNHLSFHTDIISDVSPLHGLVANILNATQNTPSLVRTMRDPTRGGLAAALNELAVASQVGMHINEENIPIKDEVYSACELLGLDPLYVANEGKLVIICAQECAENVLAAMQKHPFGRDAAIIGEVIDDTEHFVYAETIVGGSRLINWPTGELLPRIC